MERILTEVGLDRVFEAFQNEEVRKIMSSIRAKNCHLSLVANGPLEILIGGPPLTFMCHFGHPDCKFVGQCINMFVLLHQTIL